MSSNQRLWLCATALALSACDRLSDVGEQPALAPTAVAQVVGYAGADANGDSVAIVRAHTEVLLTGKESIEADKPILSFVWKAVNAADDQYVTVRNSSTVNISVPSVANARDIQYRLTVTDSDGDTDSSTVTLHVQPVLDSDRFLSYMNGGGKLRLVAATPHPSSGGAFTLALSAHVVYATRPSTLNNKITNMVDYPIGDPITGSWLASAVPNLDGGAADYRNPVFEFSLPAINLDEIIRKFQAGLPGTEGLMPDPAFTPEARIQIIAKLTSPTLSNLSLFAVDTGGVPVISANNAGSGAPVELNIPDEMLEELRIRSGGLENRATADSYYAALDPQDRRLTLSDWLKENCFDKAATNYGADAHAVYVNNFDLGFGRDMYFRSTRPANCTSTTFGPGDAASVVVNYATLEGAAKKVDPIIAVAMEYKNADASRGATGIVSFYVFAPDEGTGEFRRVTSANFDGRGEKYVPGSCTMCHGGRPRFPDAVRANTYPAGDPDTGVQGDANVNATFMPWDLESFLFSDTDPTFPTDSASAALRSQYTRAAQETEFKKLNLAAFSTYGSRNAQQVTTCDLAFEGPCDLVKLWYGDDLAATTFTNNAIGKGWRSPENPPGAEALYHDVFARNCRACHTQRVVALNPTADPQFRTYAQFVDAIGGPLSARDKIIKLVFRDAVMPAARLSMDRFWTRAPGAAASAGELLAAHFGLAVGTQPGKASACAESTPTLGTTIGDRRPITRRESANGPKTTVKLDASCSSFARSYQWDLTPPPSNNSVATFIGTNTTHASFMVDKRGDYDVRLRVTGAGGETSDALLFGIVDDLELAAAVLPNQLVNLNLTQSIDVLSLSERGDEPTVIHSVSATGPGLRADLNPVTQMIDIVANDINGGTVSYSIRDEDNDISALASFTVSVSASISIQDGAGVVDVNSGATTLALPGVVADNQPFRIELWNGSAWVTSGTITTSLPSRGGALRGSVSLINCIGTSCSVSYTPPRKTLASGTGRDTFQYRACFVADPTRCSDAPTSPGGPRVPSTYRVAITPLTQFASVASILSGGSCNLCHQADPPPGVDRWYMPPSPTPQQAYLAVRCGLGHNTNANDGLDLATATRRYVDIANPASSLLYIKPRPGIVANHGHNNSALERANVDQLGTILSWIEEGAYLTGDLATTCADPE